MTHINVAKIRKGLTLGIIFLFIITGFSSVITAQKITITKQMKNFIIKGDVSQHRLLLLFVQAIFYSRFIRAFILSMLSLAPGSYGNLVVKHPLLYLRGSWLLGTAYIWSKFWFFVSDKMGWGWNSTWRPSYGIKKFC